MVWFNARLKFCRTQIHCRLLSQKFGSAKNGCSVVYLDKLRDSCSNTNPRESSTRYSKPVTKYFSQLRLRSPRYCAHCLKYLHLYHPVLEGFLSEWSWESDLEVGAHFLICCQGFNPGSHIHLASCFDWPIVLFLTGMLSSQFKESTCLLSVLLPLTLCVCPVAQMSTWTPGMKKINACCIKSVMQVGVSH